MEDNLNYLSKHLRELACKYNDMRYFEKDPIIFPKFFFNEYKRGKVSIADVEISALLSSHLAWGRREMIVRDCKRLFDYMSWQPYGYIMSGEYKCDTTSLHRTIKWSDVAFICENLKEIYSQVNSIEGLSVEQIRCKIYGQKCDPKAANKKIHMMRRWLIRQDGKVDIGLWRGSDPANLIIPLDVHVHRASINLGITTRKSANIVTAEQITDFLKEVFPGDPCLGDFALFAHAASKNVDNG